MRFKTTKGISDNFLRTNHIDYYNDMNSFILEDGLSLSEKIWLYQNKLRERPKCLNCCNKVNFIKFYKGYRKFCCRRCSTISSHKNQEIKESRVKNMIDCNNDIETRLNMTIKSNETKRKFSDEKKSSINKKREETNILRWGVSNISNNIIIKEKISKKLKEVLPISKMNKTIERIENMLLFDIKEITDDRFILNCKKCSGEFDISRKLFNQRSRFDIDVCLLCNPINSTSNFEMNVLDYIKNNYDGEIISGYFGYKKYEIDIYLPDLKIGFECNGLYWHSEIYKENNYHDNKNKFFNDKNIRIIHIWEDDWKYKKEIVCSRINNILNKSLLIYARKCEVLEIVDNKEVSEFMESNHLQGKVNSKVKLGLYNNSKLVSVMTFGSLRKNLGRSNIVDNYELLRFCNLKNISVIGGASKLLKFFIKNYNPNNIISYASIDWSDGKLYTNLGFDFVHKTRPNYFYFNKDEGIRYNRFNFRKDKLVKDGYDINLTEHKIMNKRGYYRIYDSGSLLYELKVNKL